MKKVLVVFTIMALVLTVGSFTGKSTKDAAKFAPAYVIPGGGGGGGGD